MLLKLLNALCALYPRLAPEHQRGVVSLCQHLRPESVRVVPSHVRWLRMLGGVYPEAWQLSTWMQGAARRVR